MEKEVRLDEVTVFGGKLNVLIAHDWQEIDTEHNDVCWYRGPKPIQIGFAYL